MITFSVFIVFAWSAAAEDRLLFGLVKHDPFAYVCGCSFSETITGVEEGGYGSGATLLVMDVNGSPPGAVINVGGENLKLPPAFDLKFPMFQCSVGEPFESSWEGAGITLVAKLKVVVAGAAGCWFSGDLSASSGDVGFKVPVKGACGC